MYQLPGCLTNGIKGVSFYRNCGAASLGEYNQIISRFEC